MISPLADDRVQLRPFTPEDAVPLAAILNHPDLAGRSYLPDSLPDIPITPSALEKILAGREHREREVYLTIVAAQTGRLAGYVNVGWGWDALSPTLSIVVAPDLQRQGLGSSALRFMLAWIFGHLPAHTVLSFAADWNLPALEFMRKHGFHNAGASRRAHFWRGRYVDEIGMDLLRREWEAGHGA